MESSQLISLLAVAERDVEAAVNRFVDKLLEYFRRDGIAERRKQFGYHPYHDAHPEHKRFNQASFDASNRNWNVDSDWIGDNLKTLIPDPTSGNNSPVYALMGELSQVLTRVLRGYLDKHHGSSVLLHSVGKIRKIDDIYVQVWWKTPTGNALGTYGADVYHANGPRTTLTVVANRNQWTQWLRDEISNRISYERTNPGIFFENLANTLVHEMRHLEQDIKGTRRFSRGMLDVKGVSSDHTQGKEAYLKYLGRLTEIDAHATAAAAQVVATIIKQAATYRRRYDPSWTAERIPDEDWNERVQQAMDGIKYFEIPNDELRKYVQGMRRPKKTDNDQNREADLDPRFTDELLQAVRRRFLRTYVNRLRSYLRPLAGKKLPGPVGQLPGRDPPRPAPIDRP